jgi:hypothetical protein
MANRVSGLLRRIVFKEVMRRSAETWSRALTDAISLYDYTVKTPQDRIAYRRVLGNRKSLDLVLGILEESQVASLKHPELIDDLVLSLEELTRLSLKQCRNDIPRLVGEVRAWERNTSGKSVTATKGA